MMLVAVMVLVLVMAGSRRWCCFSGLVGAWFWVRFSKKILPILCNLLGQQLYI